MEAGDTSSLLKPSINTAGREAFAWFVGPRLTSGERQSLQAYWNGLPPFDSNMPNYNPCQNGTPAKPSRTKDGQWDWTESIQPIRWFFCPCCLRKHNCVYTGNPPMHCRGWQDICCKLVSDSCPIVQENVANTLQGLRTWA